MFTKKIALIAMLAVALAPAAALADSFIDFAIAGGAISYAGGAASMVGSGITANSVTGLATPSNSGTTLTVDFGSMSYTTGAYDPTTSTPGSVWNFFAIGPISITGCIPGVTSATCTGLNNVTLLTGSFVLPEPTAGAAGMSASFSDTKNAALLGFYGITSVGPFLGSVNEDFNIFRIGGGNSFRATGSSGGAVNDIPSATPEPASLALMGTGLVGLAGMIRRKLFS